MAQERLIDKARLLNTMSKTVKYDASDPAGSYAALLCFINNFPTEGGQQKEETAEAARKLRRTIAIDFDGCLCTENWPNIGTPNWPVIDAALQEKRNGAALILWTCREGKLLQEALEACKAWGLEFDAVNESTKEWANAWGGDTRKVGASEYWDDKAINAADVYSINVGHYNVPDSIQEQLDEIAGRVCEECCKWREHYDSEFRLYVEHCKKCPVGLL